MILYPHKKRGALIITSLVFGSIATIIIIGLVSWFAITIKASREVRDGEQAFHIAEAGIEYYRWHLAHDQDDFQDGTGGDGPYVHEFEDAEGNRIGEFTLDITPPPAGSTIVTIRSTGTLDRNPDVVRAIETKLAIPSFARYAFVANDDIRFGEGTEVFGPVHSNGGIRFDGLAHNVISSARDIYDDPDHSGSNEFGVHTHLDPEDPLPPANVPDRFDVFESGRDFPVPAVDFAGLTSDLAQIRNRSQEDEGLYFADSGGLGYSIVLNTDDTVDVYRVTSLMNVPHQSCRSSHSNSQKEQSLEQQQWGTWSVNNQEVIGSYDFPENGILFFEDHLWVEGMINGARLTIAVGAFPDTPSTRKNIIINENLLYTNYDGTDSIALIAQNNINSGLYSADSYRIDAALIAQNGRIGRHYYRDAGSGNPRCSPYAVRDTITLYGMLASNNRYGFAYSDDTGYEIRNIIYDTNLLYSPPPDFPLTSEQYETISWEEIE